MSVASARWPVHCDKPGKVWMQCNVDRVNQDNVACQFNVARPHVHIKCQVCSEGLGEGRLPEQED